MPQIYEITEIADKTWRILEAGFDAVYYLEGTARGLLIDTGVGMGNIAEAVAQIATKPYDVVLTHGHYDHLGGIYLFDRVYMNHRDLPMLADLTDANRRHFIEHYAEMSEGRSADQDASGMVPSGALPEFIDIDEGYVFSLGERDVEVWATPGHTNGSVCLLDAATRLLFASDTIIYRLLLLCDALKPGQRAAVWRSSTRRIYDRLSSFSGIYMGHSGRASDTTIRELAEMADMMAAGCEMDMSEGVPKLVYGQTQIYLGMPFKS